MKFSLTKMQKGLFIGLLILVWPGWLKAQVQFSGTVTVEAFYSSKEKLPFWFYSNRRGRISEETELAGWISGKAFYQLNENSSLDLGGGLFYQDQAKNEVNLDELYLEYRYNWFTITAGVKQREEFYNGLSATNENILWSLNARPLPGIQFRTSRPLFFNTQKSIGFEAAWEEYLLEKDRNTTGAHLHHKKFHLLLKPTQSWEIKLGLQHFAQWGGESEEFGKQPQSFKDYLLVVSGREGGEEALVSDRENVLGNHLGSWEIFMTHFSSDFKTQFIYNSIFEDGSGSRLDNFPDGRYGVFVEFADKDRIINSFIYEFFYTRDQSHDVNVWGPDAYFMNGPYYPGWTYKQRILGAPFFKYDAEMDLIVNNKFSTHHFGFSGQFSTYFNTYPYKVLISYSHNEGTYGRSLNPDGVNEDVLSLYSKFRILNRPVQIDLEAGSDFNSYREPVFGAGIQLSRRF